MSFAVPSRTAAGSALGDRGQRGEAGDAHRFTPLAISHIWSAVWIALEASWNARWASIIVDHRVGDVDVGGLERALRRAWSRAARRPAVPEAAEVTKALSPTACSACGARTVTSASLPTRRPLAVTVPSAAIEISSSGVPSGIVIARLDERAGVGGQAAAAVDVQVAVAGERLAAVGELDAEEALALDRDVERAVGALQRALREARPASTAAAPVPVRDALGRARPACW